MTDKLTGGLAFPTVLYDTKGLPTGQDLGMTLRDWFAGHAMLPTFMLMLEVIKATGSSTCDEHDLAEGAYKFADAMLKERDK